MYYCIKYRLIGAVGINIDERWVLSYDWIEADTIAIVSPLASVGLPKDEFVFLPLSVFKF
jgi:hypothetical protein